MAHMHPPKSVEVVARRRRRRGSATPCRLGAGALTSLALFATAPAEGRAATCPGADVEPTAETRDAAAAAVACVLNLERAKRDLPRLREHPRLERPASRYARAMVRGQYFSHTSPAGETMVDRLRDSRYILANRPWAVGETLAWGTGGRSTPAATVAAWMDSRPHRRVLLDPQYRELGIGVATGVPIEADAVGATYAAELGVRS
jgi:uncharacterized protein YkwD